MRFFTTILSALSLSSTIALSAEAGVRCEQAFVSPAKRESKLALATGAPMSVHQHWGRQEYDTPVSFVGFVGNSLWAVRSDGEFVIQLDGPVGEQIRKNTDLKKIPRFIEIEAQTTEDNCVETALRYIIRLKKDGEAVVPSMAPSTFNPFRNPFLVPAVSVLQEASILNTLKMNGFLPTPISGREQIEAALKSGNSVFIGAKAGNATLYLETESGDPISSHRTVVPSPSGRAGHAMIILSLFEGQKGNRFVMLADPYSGTVRPVLFDEDFVDGIVLALSI